MADSKTALPYEEPSISTVLNQTGFLLVLNLVNVCLDKLLYCGLIGQLVIGILWGTPGAKWLDRDTQTVIQQLGYLGLIMLVYEGGLSTSLPSVRANLFLSIAVALTGIGTPMALSFILMELVSATPLQAFAAGAALSATSLGTTFTILSTTGLIKTRLGTVTTSAAMLDDVVGLVMVQIITNLGGSSDSFSAVTVIRPVFVSIGFGVGVVLGCRLCIRPILRMIFAKRDKFPSFMKTIQFAFSAYSCILIGLVAGATYAGTSSLFAAYLAGVMTSWIDDFFEGSLQRECHATASSNEAAGSSRGDNSQDQAPRYNNDHPAQDMQGSSHPAAPGVPHEKTPSGLLAYEKYYAAPVGRILTPLFFASIGFAIPITEMFNGTVVWKGIVYAALMSLGKMATGTWLVRFSLGQVSSAIRALTAPLKYVVLFCTHFPKAEYGKKGGQEQGNREGDRSLEQPVARDESGQQTVPYSNSNQGHGERESNKAVKEQAGHPEQPTASVSPPPKPKSLYPPSILGLAMVARGEVGYLVASLAESKGIFGKSPSGGSSEAYLVVIWAISLCTLIGPISVGTLVRRVKTLQQRRIDSGGPDPLGVWGI
ncbi:putative Na+/H+ antiporter [Aspergillus sclerotioniger CBS 115572]|uniref:Putative Na+/H+ antiporter n=1 Tax=Aspergillus sclerotioniger CBS 115572 TaxID=1450535 RepID=A0A317X5Y7_9EURO|nr:putative Na+/H+ antiporter [Aspergillus sclerotioniger CBS 115572]PWY91960.1 putative Na+/H+ antiporter [Aspergillus sclerotioniger CBS 115572]